MLRRRGRGQEDERRVSELHQRRQELVGALLVAERYSDELAGLSDEQCAALAAAAAERLLPLYAVFEREEEWGDHAFLRHGLDLAWGVLAGEVAPEELRGIGREGEDRTVPDLGGDERWRSEWVSEAQDAAISVLLAMEAAGEGLRESALHAAQYEIDVIDNYLARTSPARHTETRPEGDTLVTALQEEVAREEATNQHPLMKEVVRLIERDLETLRRTDGLGPETVRALRSAAEESSVLARIEQA